MFSAIRWLQNRISNVISKILLTSRGVEVGSGTIFSGIPFANNARSGVIKLGKNCVVVSASRGTVLGVSKPAIFRLLTIGAKIEIGSDVGISGTTICSAISVRIGNRCLLGADTMIFDTDFHPLESEGRRYARPDWKTISAPVEIGDDVFLGARSIVMKGVHIGNGSVIGAGSVVVSDIPAGTVAAGNPAKVIRKLNLSF